MAEELLEAQAVEEPLSDDDEAISVRRLPDRARSTDVSVWRDDVKTAALAAAGGIVVGAATVAVVRATRGGSSGRRRPARRSGKARERAVNVVASRSFLVDVHLLGK